MKTCCTKDDIGVVTRELRAGIDNTNRRVDKLREIDDSKLIRKVEQIVTKQIAGSKPNEGGLAGHAFNNENEKDYLVCRRSARIWPVEGGGDQLVDNVKNFLEKRMLVPRQVVQGVQIEMVRKLEQPRRSKIHDEVLIRFANVHSRDVIQSYTPNLAEAKGLAGLRLELPDHLRGVFRQFEEHATALRCKYGQVKRAIRFEDSEKTLCMDVKLERTGWHRISHNELRTAQKKAKIVLQKDQLGLDNRTTNEEKKLVLFENETPVDSFKPVIVELDQEEDPEETGNEKSRRNDSPGSELSSVETIWSNTVNESLILTNDFIQLLIMTRQKSRGLCITIKGMFFALF